MRPSQVPESSSTRISHLERAFWSVLRQDRHPSRTGEGIFVEIEIVAKGRTRSISRCACWIYLVWSECSRVCDSIRVTRAYIEIRGNAPERNDSLPLGSTNRPRNHRDRHFHPELDGNHIGRNLRRVSDKAG